MALKVVEEQASSPPSSLPSGSGRLEPDGARGSERLVLAVIGAVVGMRFALDLVWGAESAMGPSMPSWTDAGSRAALNSALVIIAVVWCSRLGGGVLARLGTAIGVVAVPGLWEAGWSWSLVTWTLLLAAFGAPLGLSFVGANVRLRVRSQAGWIVLAVMLSAWWCWFADAGRFGEGPRDTATSGAWFIGVVHLLVVFIGWLMLLVRSHRQQRELGHREAGLPQTVRNVGLWIAIASVFVLLAMLEKGLAVGTVAAVWLVVPVGLSLEMLSSARFGRRWVLVALATLVLQMSAIGWWLLAAP